LKRFVKCWTNFQHIAKSPPPPPNPPSTTYLPYHPPSGTNPSQQALTVDPAGPDPSELAPVAHALNHVVQLSTSNQPSSSATLGVDASQGPDKIERTKTGRALEEVERPVPRADKSPRWCRFCEIYKPDRTHHCRHCGTCVMQFDREFSERYAASRTNNRSLRMDRTMRGLGESQGMFHR
jgi:palmitoyltransferase